MVSVLVELAWAFRRAGVALAPSQTIDMASAIALVGFESPSRFKEALRAIVVTRREHDAGFERAFGRAFGRDATHPAMSLEERLGMRGLTKDEIEYIASWFDEREGDHGTALAAWLARGVALDRVVARSPSWESLRTSSPDKVGFFVHRLMGESGLADATAGVASILRSVRELFGAEREALVKGALDAELEASRRELGHAARERAPAPETSSTRDATRSLAALTSAERHDVERALRRLVEGLEGSARVRRRHRERGPLHVGKTVRMAQRTFGVPIRLVRRVRRPPREKLVLLCDLSDSVRDAARFFLLFAYLARECFEATRVFVFVSDLREATRVFEREAFERAAAVAWSGGVVSIVGNSNYGRALRTFVEEHRDAVDAKTTVLVLGDGRTNFGPDGREALEAIAQRARSVVWLCPEPKGLWGTRDSAMPVYQARVSRALPVSTTEELLKAAYVLR